ncbi:RNA polymerase I second largest subunit [Perkinsela sp. CCAP 1560/4]|nr:RNA polymerase I second largest subunit [Perkinsela sp. CCAP 1560/4]|eukprot:KNH03701.1 RNA polymerase I second largest subunit [Perkinsela sp. CCAP 1560/4]
MASKKAALQQRLTHFLERFCAIYQEVELLENDQVLDNIVCYVRDKLLAALKTNVRMHDNPLNETITESLARISQWQAECDSSHATTVKGSKGDQLKSVLQVLKMLFDKSTSSEKIMSVYDALEGQLENLVGLQVDSWNDAVKHGIPGMVKEDYYDKTMSTHQLDLPEKTKFVGSTISTYCVDLFFGMDFHRSPAMIVNRVFSEKIGEARVYLQKSLKVFHQQIIQQTALSSSPSSTADGKKVSETAFDALNRIQKYVATLEALIQSNGMIEEELRKLYELFTTNKAAMWSDIVRLKHWDRKVYGKYFPGNEEEYRSFRAIMEKAEMESRNFKGAPNQFILDDETRGAITRIYKDLTRIGDDYRKTFVAQASQLYDRFVSDNALYLGPSHCIRNNKDYAEDIYMQVGFRFAFSNKTSKESQSEGSKSKRYRVTKVSQKVDHKDGFDEFLAEHVKENGAETSQDSITSAFSHMELEAYCGTSDLYGIAYPTKLLPDGYKFYFCLGRVPIMVKSELCVLHKLSKIERPLGEYFEDTEELGGQFVVKGSEKLLRNFTCPRTNFPLCLERAHFARNGKHFTSKAIVYHSQMQSGRVMRSFFHHLKTGEILMSVNKKSTYFIPVVLLLLCLKSVSPYSLQKILQSRAQSDRSISRIETLIRHHGMKPYASVLGTEAHWVILGRLFRTIQAEKNNSFGAFPLLPQCFIAGADSQPQRSDEWYGLYVIRRFLFPHLNAAVPFDDFDNFAHELREEHARKFDLLLNIILRLFDFVEDIVQCDSVDKLSHQGIFTPGRLLVGVVSDTVNKALDIVARAGVTCYTSKFDAIFASPDFQRKPMPSEIEQYLRHVGSEKVFTEHGNSLPTARFQRLLSTGAYTIDRELGSPVPQFLGLSLAYERLNSFRQVELIRNIHRGKSVAESRSSDIRRCRQENWGFLCVVNTPDGELCGVSQQLALSARITTVRENLRSFKNVRKSFLKRQQLPNSTLVWEGMNPVSRILIQAVSQYVVNASMHSHEQLAHLPTLCVDGHIAGYISLESSVNHLGMILREFKASPDCPFPFCEVIEQVHPFPGTLLVFTSAGSLYRPIQKSHSNSLVMVGTWEQTYLDIAAVHADLTEARDVRLSTARQFEYIEPDPSATLSYTANCIPFFEYNCSPRNLFVCGIIKQSLGNVRPNIKLRCDSKNYVMPTTQKHLVHTDLHTKYDMGMNSVNVNAVVAIMSYSGLDMEDAIVMNERCINNGMFDGNVLAGRRLLAEQKMRSSFLEPAENTGQPKTTIVFHNVKISAAVGEACTLCYEGVAANGLPLARHSAQTTFREPSHYPWTPLYVVAKKISLADGTVRYVDHTVFTWGSYMDNLDESEAGWVHAVLPVAFDGPDPVEVFIVTRKNRNVVIGDKFSSRHGQKGTLSYLMHPQDMPFCMNSGITPDILINPHAFPSRMTVGMMLELAAGKVVALSGQFWNASPWGGETRWDHTMVDNVPHEIRPKEVDLKKLDVSKHAASLSNAIFAARSIRTELIKYGFEPFAGEEMLSGETGEAIEADIFIGICGYQKLRHLVKDKWQTRARTDHVRTRAVKKTGQPQAGKKRHGGNRVGEMERDALLSHGATEVLLDRLMVCSDQTRGYVCKECGGMFTIAEKCATAAGTFKFCYYCALKKDSDDLGISSDIVLMDMPQALRLLVAEMQSVGVRIAMKF